MTCKCHKPKWQDYETPPNTVCIYCADKHLTLANVLYDELDPMKNRPAILGELECARRHLGSGYPDVAAELSTILSAYMAGDPFDRDALDRLMDSVLSIESSTSGGEDRHIGTYDIPYMRQDKPGAPFICELALSMVARLLDETGYEKANRHLIVGFLTMAQLCAAKWNMEYAKVIRDIRHDYQVSGKMKNPGALDDILIMVSKDVAEHVQEYIEKYGKDFKWFLDI